MDRLPRLHPPTPRRREAAALLRRRQPRGLPAAAATGRAGWRLPARRPAQEPAGCGIWHIARGARWSWRGIRFLGVGGGYSIDKRLRAPGIDWFPEESISDEQYQQITSDPDQVDVCVFHDAPYGAPLPFELYPIFDAVWNRELLAKIVNHVRPALILHAHYHVAYEGRWQDEDTGASAGVIGLDCDLNPQRSWLVLDLDQARSRFGALRQGEQPGLLPECEAEPPA